MRLFSRKNLSALFLFILITCAAINGFAQDDLTVDQINKAIAASGKNWVAGHNPIMDMEPEQRRMMLGQLENEDPADFGITPWIPEGSGAKIPTSLDWRDRYGNWVTPVRNQLWCGSCWAFAATAAFESAYLIFNNLPGQDFNLSEQDLVSCSGAGTCDGGWTGSALYYIRDTGIPDEDCFPYWSLNLDCAKKCTDWESRVETVSMVYSVAHIDELIKEALQFGPVTTSYDVYTDFYSYDSGVYEHTTGVYEGRHAVLIVGYDDAEQAWICKNSWGKFFGENGYFRIRYGNSDIGSNVYTVRYEDPADDYYEENDLAGRAYPFINQPDTLLSTTHGPGIANDPDYFIFYNSATLPLVTVELEAILSGNDNVDVCITDDHGVDAVCEVGDPCSRRTDGTEYIACQLPTQVDSYFVRVWNEQGRYIEYDFQYSFSEPCDGCFIDGVCVAEGTVDSNNICGKCDPSVSFSQWSPNDVSCDDGLYCNGTDSCSGGICVHAGNPCEDGLFCNGAETCDEGTDGCASGNAPCDPLTETCDESADSCEPLADDDDAIDDDDSVVDDDDMGDDDITPDDDDSGDDDVIVDDDDAADDDATDDDLVDDDDDQSGNKSGGDDDDDSGGCGG